MCFYVDPRHPDEKTAKRDITCYKAGNVKEVWIMDSERKLKITHQFLSPYYYYLYDFEKLYRLPRSIRKRKISPNVRVVKCVKTTYRVLCPDGFVIYNGFHSYSNKAYIAPPYYMEGIIVKCTIPKGAKYYYNSYLKEYVSDSIIINQLIGDE